MKQIVQRSVLVLNQTYEPLHICDVKRAITLILQQKASVVQTVDHLYVHTISQSYPVPSVIRIHQYIHVHHWEAVLNKTNIFRRDNYTCQYCGARNVPMTIDHVIPKVRGGGDTWTNLVTACVACNNRKGNHLPEEIGFKLLNTPRQPHKIHTMQRFLAAPIDEWRQYLFLK